MILVHPIHSSPEDLQHEIHRPHNIKIFRKLSIEKSQTNDYFLVLKAYRQSSLQVFESYLRNFSPLGENDIELILRQYISQVTTYETSPGI